MDRITKKKRLFLALIIVNILFIWANSLLPGSISGAISGFVKDLVYKIFPGLSGSGEGGHGLLRKLGHFTEFACLGALLTRFLFLLQKPRLLAVAVAFLVGCCDETIQRFIPDRGPSFRDVLIDTAGATAGMICCLLGMLIAKDGKNKQRRKIINEKMDRIFADPDAYDVPVSLQMFPGTGCPRRVKSHQCSHRYHRSHQACVWQIPARHNGGECQ